MRSVGSREGEGEERRAVVEDVGVGKDSIGRGKGASEEKRKKRWKGEGVKGKADKGR